jgi:hypothetical protein
MVFVLGRGSRVGQLSIIVLTMYTVRRRSEGQYDIYDTTHSTRHDDSTHTQTLTHTRTYLTEGLDLRRIMTQEKLKVQHILCCDAPLHREPPGPPHGIQGHVGLELEAGLPLVRAVADGVGGAAAAAAAGGGASRKEEEQETEEGEAANGRPHGLLLSLKKM